jgi:hypothetical protein
LIAVETWPLCGITCTSLSAENGDLTSGKSMKWDRLNDNWLKKNKPAQDSSGQQPEIVLHRFDETDLLHGRFSKKGEVECSEPAGPKRLAGDFRRLCDQSVSSQCDPQAGVYATSFPGVEDGSQTAKAPAIAF